jgi:YfiH family protein
LRAFGRGIDRLVVSRQVHGHVVGVHTSVPPGVTLLDGQDAHATANRGVALALTVADCVPVYLIDPRARTIALAHCGWRGIAGGVLERAVEALAGLRESHVADIVMHCGISICGECYEVGSEVVVALGGKGEGPAHVDLRHALVNRARALGIRQVTVSPWCSAHHGDRFYSHRASKGADGRMVAYLGLPLA